LFDSRVREKFGVTVVGVKRAQTDFQHAVAETEILPDDLLIVSGPTRKIQQFANDTARRKDK
jgi:trk system potassium uptake protein TrkA